MEEAERRLIVNSYFPTVFRGLVAAWLQLQVKVESVLGYQKLPWVGLRNVALGNVTSVQGFYFHKVEFE